MKHHIVKRGDTLSGIAARYGVTVAQIAAVNTIQNVNMIFEGQALVIPEVGTLFHDNAAIGEQLIKTLDAIEALPEFKEMERMLSAN